MFPLHVHKLYMYGCLSLFEPKYLYSIFSRWKAIIGGRMIDLMKTKGFESLPPFFYESHIYTRFVEGKGDCQN